MARRKTVRPAMLEAQPDQQTSEMTVYAIRNGLVGD